MSHGSLIRSHFALRWRARARSRWSLARWLGGLAHWPLATLLVLWPSFGGHLVELWFLNWLRPRLPVARAVQVGIRVVVWFIGGTGLALGMRLTAIVLAGFRSAHWPAWWLGGLAFIGIELAAHLVLRLRGRSEEHTSEL